MIKAIITVARWLRKRILLKTDMVLKYMYLNHVRSWNLVEIGSLVLEKNIFKSRQCIFGMSLLFPCIKECGPSFDFLKNALGLMWWKLVLQMLHSIHPPKPVPPLIQSNTSINLLFSKFSPFFTWRLRLLQNHTHSFNYDIFSPFIGKFNCLLFVKHKG